MIHRIAIELVRYADKGGEYRVHYKGEVLLEATRLPIFDSCRALLAMGHTGTLQVRRLDRDCTDAQCDIEAGAALTIREAGGSTAMIRVEKWRPGPGGRGFEPLPLPAHINTPADLEVPERAPAGFLRRVIPWIH